LLIITDYYLITPIISVSIEGHNNVITTAQFFYSPQKNPYIYSNFFFNRKKRPHPIWAEALKGENKGGKPKTGAFRV